MKQYRVRLCMAALAAMFAVGASDAFAQGQGRKPAAPAPTFNMIPMLVQSVTFDGTQLVANIVAGSSLVDPVPISLTPQQVPGAACPILNLALGPINLDLLGLNVDTSPICLDITAVPGSGALLGNLLCNIASLLQAPGATQAGVLASLTPAQLGLLDRGLTQLLNQALFIPLTSSNAVVSATCNVLNLALGPVDLNLLGLRVQLDNCSDGPVTVDITADPEGGLLGSLLCGLANLLNGTPPTGSVLTLLQNVAALIGALLG